MKKNIIWILVANAHEAKIFEKNLKERSFNLLQELSAELDTNHEKPTSSFNSTGTLRHGVEPHTDRRDVEKQKFATQISKALENADKNNQFEDLILLASPQMLGILEKTFSTKIQQKISAKFPKNIVDFKTHEIEKYLVEVQK